MPKDWLLPVPPALYPLNGLDEAKPFPDEKELPPFWADAIATPVADTPFGPAFPVPNPAPFPDAAGLVYCWDG